MTDAMFYLDLVTKDRKIAAPAGLRDCTSGVCPELVESPLAAVSNENVAANLRAFEALFLGGEPGDDGDGFDDLLASVGEGELAERMRTNLGAAIGSADGLEAPSPPRWSTTWRPSLRCTPPSSSSPTISKDP
ncbi:MAG: hypothetical protein M5U28_16760 [Sandaracinaceae bacterium]|nr:hypothetical protein [Sandaracinaceae bacterium]